MPSAGSFNHEKRKPQLPPPKSRHSKMGHLQRRMEETGAFAVDKLIEGVYSVLDRKKVRRPRKNDLRVSFVATLVLVTLADLALAWFSYPKFREYTYQLSSSVSDPVDGLLETY